MFTHLCKQVPYSEDHKMDDDVTDISAIQEIVRINAGSQEGSSTHYKAFENRLQLSKTNMTPIHCLHESTHFRNVW